MTTGKPDYLFRHGTAEQERLRAQGGLLDPITARLLAYAGLAPGARVLDLGSGAGNVALLAADIVGPEGSVVGVDGNAGTVAEARDRAARLGVGNVEYRVGDVQTLDGVEDGFDAVVGRLVYMYLADPAAALRAAAARVRPGGLVCLQEADMSYTWAAPATPLWNQVHEWLQETMRRAGIRARMGHELYATFRAAGLPEPAMNLESLVVGGASAPAYGWADVVTAALPLMERLGVTTRAELDPDTLSDRLHADLVAHDGVMITGPLVGAWATLPDA